MSHTARLVLRNLPDTLETDIMSVLEEVADNLTSEFNLGRFDYVLHWEHQWEDPCAVPTVDISPAITSCSAPETVN